MTETKHRVRKRINPVKGYSIVFLLGVIASISYPVEEIHAALEIVGVLMLVALFASLLVPFAAFSHHERSNKFILQYAPLLAFGSYAVVVGAQPSVVKIVIMVSAMAMHISYWSSGLHSRNYRMEQWRIAGFCTSHPQSSRIIAVWNGSGHAELGDALLQHVFTATPISAELATELRNSPHYDEALLRQEIGELLP